MNSVDMESIKSHTGKDRLTVTLIIDDEEVELNNDAEEAESIEESTEDTLYSLDDETTTIEGNNTATDTLAPTTEQDSNDINI